MAWENLPSTNTPLNATNLNQFERHSTSEIVIGKWIDNKPIYRKVITINSLPVNSLGRYPHNILNVNSVIKCYGECFKESGEIGRESFSLPISNIYLWGDLTNIDIATTSDRSSFKANIVIEYTKTTD